MRVVTLVPFWLTMALVAVAGSATAQTSAEASVASNRAWSIASSLTVRETFTDNVTPGQGAKASDQITEVSPGVRLSGNTPRMKMHLDYRLRELYYAQGSRGSQTQHSLNSFGTLEAIEKLLFVDASGTISQQSISAFGVQSPDYYSNNNNSTQTTNLRFSPYFKGQLGGYADYEARYTLSALRAESKVASDSDVQEWRGRINGDTPLAFLTWSAEAIRQSFDYSRGRKTESDTFRGRAYMRVDPQLKLSASIGRERNDFSLIAKQTWNTYGYGADWSPTERTQVSASREKRFFGQGHNVSIAHRLPRSAVKFTDSRSVSGQPNQPGSVGLGNIYDLLFSQMSSSIPDETERAAYVNNLLQQSGIAPNAQVNPTFFTSQVTIMRRQELSYVLRGARNTMTVALNRSHNDRVGLGSSLLATGDDFSNASAIVQQGATLNWSHQLSATSALNLTGARSRSTGAGTTSGASLSSNQKSLAAGFTTKLGVKTSAALTARRTEVDGSSSPYTENSVVGSVTVQF